MNPPVVSAVSAFTALQYRVSVTAPYPGGAGVALEEFTIRLATSSGAFAALSECDGASAGFRADLYCDVDLATLTAAPFSLALGDEVRAEARAGNSLGFGAYSAASSGGGLIVAVPAAPSASPVRDEPACTETEVTVNMPQVTGPTDTGGLPLLSYELEWDQGGGAFVALVGDAPDSLATAFTVAGLTTGQPYSFRYRVRNQVGASPAYSPVLLTYAGVVPG
jgi:hypothetical protein